MANVFAIRSFTSSIATWLGNQYTAVRAVVPGLPAFTFSVVTGSQLALEDGPNDNTAEMNRVTIYLYRAVVDPHLRQSGRPQRPDMDPSPLSANVHLLFSIWSPNPGDEHLMLGWLMRTMNEQPILDSSSLSFDGGWGPDDVIHLIPEELSVENMMRIWDALTPSYRLSLSYIARVIRIDPDLPQRESLPVVGTRFRMNDRVSLIPP